ncbi:diguanylate cyclase [Shewanella sairae]|uniref:Diguanylate cyclase n=1 Tax=Shewanella sairae TaxID=190310 RepID=A0ABQ4PHW1_9GAMM|nr:7TM diverse intracellular signaling domain-containing protein [Shewanella sairae]MCL1131368.1 diguanylate cyclase [Shewanella sairae]GIU47145.1 diguanylate cyclase [Shewanella sairae]
MGIIPLTSWCPNSLCHYKHDALVDETIIYAAHSDEDVPKNYQQLFTWMQNKQDLAGVSLSGGSYWMVSAVVINSYNEQWVVNVKNSLIESVDYWVFGDDGSVQFSHSGYYAPYEFLFDYGRSVKMTAGVDYWLVARVESRYFSSQPKIQVQTFDEHKRGTDVYALFIILCLGGLLFIALYNWLIYASIGDKAFLYYGCYVSCYFIGWALTFHLPAHLFDLHGLQVHHLFFISLPIFNILFYKHFLQLPEQSPKLWRLSLGLMWLCIIALPTSIFLLSYTAIIASVLIMLWIALAMVCGNVCLLKGFHPARYFLLAFTCLLLPAVLILPGNMGLTPDFFDNAELATLVGGTVDALLLSFALAYKIRLLSEEKERHIERLEKARKNARTDKLTGLLNRFAFDEVMVSTPSSEASAAIPLCLMVINVEGLVQLIKKLGHNEVDKLICGIATAIDMSEENAGSTNGLVGSYRLSDSSFALVFEASKLQHMQEKINWLQSVYLSENYTDVSIHSGYSLKGDTFDPRQWLRQAEHQLYSNKSDKRKELYTKNYIPSM